MGNLINLSITVVYLLVCFTWADLPYPEDPMRPPGLPTMPGPRKYMRAVEVENGCFGD